MDGILHFAANSLTLGQITYIHHEKDIPPYAFAYHISTPQFQLPRHHHRRTTHTRRYYLNKRCLSQPWQDRKIGPLYTPRELRQEDVKIGDFVALDIKHSQKGTYGVNYLPPSWANCLVKFFQYYVNHVKTRWMLESQETRTILEKDIMIPLFEIRIPTLFHALVCLTTKNFGTIIDMLRFPRLRHTKYQSFQDLQDMPLIKQMDLHIPSATEFVVEVAFWAQDPQLLAAFATQLQAAVRPNPTNFKPEAQEFLDKQDKVQTYMKRVLRHLSKP
jgi:hypothetical protein